MWNENYTIQQPSNVTMARGCQKFGVGWRGSSTVTVMIWLGLVTFQRTVAVKISVKNEGVKHNLGANLHT